MQIKEGTSEQLITYRRSTVSVTPGAESADPEKTDRVMLVRNRKSRIYFMRKFFAYPISFSPQTLTNFGLSKTMKVGFSYVKASLFPVKPENTLEQFLTNRFGKELYLTFFKDYTEKVWGVPCNKDQRCMGRSTNQGVVSLEGSLSLRHQPISWWWRCRPEGHRNLFDRAFSLIRSLVQGRCGNASQSKLKRWAAKSSCKTR